MSEAHKTIPVKSDCENTIIFLTMEIAGFFCFFKIYSSGLSCFNGLQLIAALH